MRTPSQPHAVRCRRPSRPPRGGRRTSHTPCSCPFSENPGRLDQQCEIPDCDTGVYYTRACEDFGTFEMHAENAPHHALPDMMVDVRHLENMYVDCSWSTSPPGSGPPNDIALRIDFASANVGTGDLRIEQLRPGGECNADEDCPSGHICKTQGVHRNRCVASPCLTTKFPDDCPGELVCDLTDHLCKPAQCGKDSHCATHGVDRCLPFGQCGPYDNGGFRPCGEDIGCTQYDVGHVCGEEEKCVGRPCDANNPCPQTGSSVCDEGICKQPDPNPAWCHTDAECKDECVLENGLM